MTVGKSVRSWRIVASWRFACTRLGSKTRIGRCQCAGKGGRLVPLTGTPLVGLAHRTSRRIAPGGRSALDLKQVLNILPDLVAIHVDEDPLPVMVGGALVVVMTCVRHERWKNRLGLLAFDAAEHQQHLESIRFRDQRAKGLRFLESRQSCAETRS